MAEALLLNRVLSILRAGRSLPMRMQNMTQERFFKKRETRQVDTFIHIQAEDIAFGDVIYN